ncbi:MAG: electron transfer flavoprotein subunit alpha/FixB family protein [Terracidiphilus sp.]
MSSILVVQEARRDGSARIFQETLAAGRKLAALTRLPLEAAAVGDPNTNIFREITGAPPIAGHAIRHPLLAAYTADGYVLAFEQLIRKLEPRFVLFPHSYQTRDFVPRLAARFGQALIGDVTAIEDGPAFERQLFQGRIDAAYRHTSDGPCFISIQNGAFRAGEPSSGAMPVSEFAPAIESAQIRTRPSEPFRESAQTVDLGSAQRIVGVGRGIKAADNMQLVEALASALDAELAASRPICDNGWLPMERQVGSSGQTVAPKLYLAIGISGAIQHLVGMKGSQCIVAVNKDADAPIFEVADYGIVGDLFEVVPALTEAVKAAR